MPYLGLHDIGLIAAITAASGMGFILFGFDNGVLGGILSAPDFVQQFNLSPTMQGTVTALFELGCAIGCIASSFSGDRFGRLAFIHVGSVGICIGAALQAASFQVAQMIVGRIVAGIGLGFITSNVTVWQAELVPRNLRGTLVCATLSFLIAGSLLAYWLDYAMNSYTGPLTWRFPLAFQSFIALFMSFMLFFMPESPRWLILHKRDDEAITILRLLKRSYNNNTLSAAEVDALVATDVAEIKHGIERESETTRWVDLLKDDKVRSRRRVLVAVMIQTLQAFSGSTPINYYTTIIFQNSIGMSRHLALLMSGFLDIWFLIASFGTWYLIENVGRRKLFLTMAAAMAIVMAIFSAMLAIDTRASGIVAAVMIFLYVSFFTWGWMGGCWVYPAEILPLEWRSKGMGLAVASQWLWTFVMIEITPVGIANIGYKLYIIFAIFNACFVPLVYFFVPETAGFSLEDVDFYYMDRSVDPVTGANRMRKSIKKGEAIRNYMEGDMQKPGVIAQEVEKS
ncbi:general substrate transporter [Xylogone sp. PMI_703]|nr:general substrate transporter [Xylogone sp. PMI_703]